MIKKAFTLIEILIALAIISALTAIGVPVIQGFITSSKESTAKDNLRSIAFMQQGQYRESKQYYPCPQQKTDTKQLDRQFFGGNGDLTNDNYEYEVRKGCNDYLATAIRTASASRALCFSIDPSTEIKQITCPAIASKQSTNKNTWKQTYEHKAMGMSNPALFDWNGSIGGRTTGTHIRTTLTQNGKKFFADELGITDYDLSSRSWQKCQSRYQQISNGTLENKIKRWGYSGHKNNMYPGGKGLPYARSNLSNGRC